MSIGLIGDLGAGKTTLTQAMGAAWALPNRLPVRPLPSFKNIPDAFPCFTLDPYRLERPEDVADLGFDEYFERGGVVIVEWADKVAFAFATGTPDVRWKSSRKETQ